MPLVLEVMQTISVGCPEWESHFWGCNSPCIHTTEDERCTLTPWQDEGGQADFSTHTPAPTPPAQGFSPGPGTNKGLKRTRQTFLTRWLTPLMTKGYHGKVYSLATKTLPPLLPGMWLPATWPHSLPSSVMRLPHQWTAEGNVPPRGLGQWVGLLWALSPQQPARVPGTEVTELWPVPKEARQGDGRNLGPSIGCPANLKPEKSHCIFLKISSLRQFNHNKRMFWALKTLNHMGLFLFLSVR